MQAFFIFDRASAGLALALLCIASASTALQLSPAGSGIALQRILWLGDGPLGGEFLQRGMPYPFLTQFLPKKFGPPAAKSL